MRLKWQSRAMLAWLLLAMALAGQTQAAAPAVRVSAVQAVAAISTTVAEMDRSVAFYSDVLSFRKMSDQEIELADAAPRMPASRRRVVRMRLGDESIELVQFEGERGRPIPADSHSNDLWFQHIAIIVSDMERAYAVLQANRVPIAAQWPALAI